MRRHSCCDLTADVRHVHMPIPFGPLLTPQARNSTFYSHPQRAQIFVASAPETLIVRL